MGSRLLAAFGTGLGLRARRPDPRGRESTLRAFPGELKIRPRLLRPPRDGGGRPEKQRPGGRSNPWDGCTRGPGWLDSEGQSLPRLACARQPCEEPDRSRVHQFWRRRLNEARSRRGRSAAPWKEGRENVFLVLHLDSCCLAPPQSPGPVPPAAKGKAEEAPTGGFPRPALAGGLWQNSRPRSPWDRTTELEVA